MLQHFKNFKFNRCFTYTVLNTSRINDSNFFLKIQVHDRFGDTGIEYYFNGNEDVLFCSPSYAQVSVRNTVRKWL